MLGQYTIMVLYQQTICDAVPSKLPGCPTYLSRPSLFREDPNVRQERLENAFLQASIQESLVLHAEYLDELASKLRCNKEQSKYMCPRCNVLYCSLLCYQSPAHIECSESFYKDNVLQNLKSAGQDSQSQKNMLEILKRFQECTSEEQEHLDSDDEEEAPELSERLQNVNLDDADMVWQKLTPAERKEFEALLQNGDASELIPRWEPWWLFRLENKLVEEADSAVVKDYFNHCPKVKADVPALSKISKSSPSPCVKYNIMNVLAAYCYVARYFNGDHHTMATESSNILINISGNLSLNHNYESAVMAVEAVSHQILNCSWLGGSVETTAQMKKDVECILAGPEHSNSTFYLLAALSDIHRLLWKAQHNTKTHAAKGEFSKKFVDHPFPLTVTKEKQRHCLRKLEYYLSWSKDCASELCDTFLTP